MAVDAGETRRTKRIQVSRACERCRRLQKGCSQTRPCTRCIKADLPCSDDGTPNEHSNGPFEFESPFAQTAPLIDLPATSPSVLRGGLPLQRNQNLLPALVLDYCEAVFLRKVYLTIPIVTPDYLEYLRQAIDAPEPDGDAAWCLLTAFCAHVFLLVEDAGTCLFPEHFSGSNLDYGKALLSEALSAREHTQRRPASVSLPQVLGCFFIYSCESALSHHSLAFYFLREAATLFLLLKVDSDAQDELQVILTGRLFWVLLISERSHAVRYRRPITLQLTARAPDAGEDPTLAGFRNLVALFRPLNTPFIALLNQEEQAVAPDFLAQVEISINQAIDQSVVLQNEQKSNLRVTQLWLRVILWQLRLRLGHLAQDAHPQSLTYHYPLEVAKDLTLSIRDLPIDCISVHGVGLTEKIFDVACALVDVLARIPLTAAETHSLGFSPSESLHYLGNLIAKLPGGETYGSLLSKHAQHTLPGRTSSLSSTPA